MNKKLICIMIILVIIQGIFLVTDHSKANSGEVKISVNSATGSIGDQVSIDINLDNNVNFVSTNLILSYDVEHLEYVSYEKGEVLKSGGMSIVENNSDTGKIAIGYVGNPSDEGTIVQAGNILKIVFKLKSNFDKETNLILEATSLKDREGTDLTSDIINGKVKIAVKEDDTLPDDNDDANDNINDSENNKENDNINDSENNKENDNINDSENNKENDNTNGSGNNNTNNTESEKELPNAGVFGKDISIIMYIILIITSVILYKKNKYMKEII